MQTNVIRYDAKEHNNKKEMPSGTSFPVINIVG